MAKRSNTGTARRADGSGRKLDPDEIVAYLRAHPKFLADHPDLVTLLTPPSHHSGKGVVDMQQFMIERLQGEIEQHGREQSELLSASRRNLSSQSRIHGAALEIIAAQDFEQMVEIITTDLAVRIDADVACLCVEAGGPVRKRSQRPGVRLLEPGTIDRVMGSGRSVILRRTDEPSVAVYGSGAPLVASEGLLRLEISEDSPEGLLALGSRNPVHFEGAQGTGLLQFLARVIEITIRAWLGLAA